MRREHRTGSLNRAFTLLEMLIAITIFSLIVLYLYQSLSTLNSTNRFYGEKLNSMSHDQKLLKTIYLDLSTAVIRTVNIINEDPFTDIVLMQTAHSVHRRIMPYVGYIIKEGELFRIESSQKLSYPLSIENEMVVDELGQIQHFRLYSSPTHFLLDYRSHSKEPRLLKIRALNY